MLSLLGKQNIRLLAQRAAAAPLLRSPHAGSVAAYHASVSPQMMARWGGAKASEARPREPSRKQLQRKRAAVRLRNEKSDKSKEKLSQNFMEKQMETPQFKDLLTQQNPQLNAAVRAMMVPDSMAALSGGDPSAMPALDPHAVMAQLEASFAPKHAETKEAGAALSSSKELSSTPVDISEANKALVAFASSSDISNTKKMLQLLTHAQLPVRAKTLTEVMKCFNKNQAYSDSVELFNKLDSAFGVPHPDGFAWACLIGARVGLGELEEAIRIKKHLEKSGVVLVAEMYNPILFGLMRAGRHDDVFDYWVEMKCNGINPNRESYDIMIEQCEVRGQPERAFFLLDEMRLAEVKPDLSTFVHIFRACASAPHWVNGYQDIVFDGLAAMEGQELMPNTDVYNSILYAFARAGDGVAADFYLQEMKKKQIKPNEASYNNVITAYANNQMVGAKAYGMLGRYVRPKDAPDNERQALYKNIGFDKVTELMSKEMYKEPNPERGSRQKSPLMDLADLDEEVQESFEENLKLELRAMEARGERKPVRAENSAALEGGRRAQEAPRLPEDYKAMLEKSRERIGASDPVSADEDDASLLMDPSAIEKLLGGDEELNKMLSAMGGTALTGADSLEELMKKFEDLNGTLEGKDGMLDGSGGSDNSIFMSEADQKEWEALLGDLNNLEAEGNNVKALESGNGSEDVDLDDLPTQQGAQSDESESLSADSENDEREETTESYETLNSYLKELDKTSGGLTKQEHYLASGKSITGADLKYDEQGLLSMGNVDEMWNFIEFGRAPDPDYSGTLRDRRSSNVARAMELYGDMVDSDIAPGPDTLASLISVFGNAGRIRNVKELVSQFKEVHNVEMNRRGYDALIKTHILSKDIDSALQAKDECLKKNIVPGREAYGMLLQSLTNRNMLEQALLTLEECSDKGVKIQERNIKKLRARCEDLGVIHPNLPANPAAWVKAVKEVRKNKRNTSQRRIEPIRSSFYT